MAFEFDDNAASPLPLRPRMTCTVAHVKNWKGTDGIGYQATLVVDGVKAATFTDDGDGGPVRWDVHDVEVFRRFALAHDVPEPLRNGMVVCDTAIDVAAASLVDAHELQKKLRRWCKTMTVFALPGDPEGEFRTVKRPYDAAVRAFLVKKYGAVVRIYNEEVTE